MSEHEDYCMEQLSYGKVNGTRGDRGKKGRCRPGADSKDGGSFGRLEYSTSNTLFNAQLGKRGTKDA